MTSSVEHASVVGLGEIVAQRGFCSKAIGPRRFWRVGFSPRGALAPLPGSEAKASRGLKPVLQCIALVLALGTARGAVVIDRIAVIVDKRVIKLSDIQRDLRATAFLNREPLRIDPDTMHKSAERLIDQALIAQEIARGGYAKAPEADADAMLNQLERDRFGASQARLRQELARYGLSESQLREQLLWQLTVLRFIDDRFRPAVQCGNEAAAQKEVDKNFDDWLAQARKRAHIEYRPEAFQ